MPWAAFNHASVSWPWRKSSPRPPGARRQLASPIAKPCTQCCRNDRTATSYANSALSIEGLDTYILRPRDPADFDLVVEALRPAPSPLDVDVVIGIRGPIAPPESCNGLMVPMVAFDQLYSFDREALVKAIPKLSPYYER